MTDARNRTQATYICVPLMGATCADLAAQIDAARTAGTEMIELRLDDLKHWSPGEIAELVHPAREAGLRIIATCRIASEGGRYVGDESARFQLLQTAARAGADYIDVEYEAWLAAGSPQLVEPEGGSANTRLILSKHDFTRTPEDLPAILDRLRATPAGVIKLACRAESITDALRMLDLLYKAQGDAAPPAEPATPQYPPQPPLLKGGSPPKERPLASPPLLKGGPGAVIALSMGEAGIITRVLAKKLGALLTFAALDTGRESAPGQPTLGDLRDLYRWDAIQPDTPVYGVIGCPVGHSMSPAIHNAAFADVGHGGVYLPLRVEPSYEAFAEFLDGCLSRPWLHLHGLSVTIPHKENLLRYVQEHGGEIDPLTRRIGVANTLVIEPRVGGVLSVDCGGTGGTCKLYAFNTDYRGALDALCEGLGCKWENLGGWSVAILGAGGVSRAIVAGLRDCGAEVTVYNRTFEKARALADEFGARARPWEDRSCLDAQVVINCTSIGMWPKTDETPLPDWPRARPMAVFDTIYNPIETRLLREARRHGRVTIDGVAMFVNQAAAQFERWTHRKAPTRLMRDVVLRKLASL
jgi:3-dehydroquinate dehydratase/shikimate dehydrogenase